MCVNSPAVSHVDTHTQYSNVWLKNKAGRPSVSHHVDNTFGFLHNQPVLRFASQTRDKWFEWHLFVRNCRVWKPSEPRQWQAGQHFTLWSQAAAARGLLHRRDSAHREDRGTDTPWEALCLQYKHNVLHLAARYPAVFLWKPLHRRASGMWRHSSTKEAHLYKRLHMIINFFFFFHKSKLQITICKLA